MKSILRLLAFLLVVQSADLIAQPQTSVTLVPSLKLPATDDGLPGTGTIRRYDWFQRLWLLRRSQWAADVEKDQGAVVFLGDSITQQWEPNGFNRTFGNMKVANRGISGDTTRGVLIRMDDDVLKVHPKAVVILIGTNDLEEKDDPETIAANLKLILAKLKGANPNMPIILNKVFPSSASKSRPADKIKRINELYTAAVKGDPQITLMETWELFATPEGDAIPSEFPDLLHPNKAGYAKWAAGLQPIFETLGLASVAPDAFTPEPGFKSLFNGHDLTGWGYRVTSEADRKYAREWKERDPNAPPWPIYDAPKNFDGKTATDDGRYLAKNDRIVVTTPPTIRKVQQIWTQQEFGKDFVLKLEFRATPYADSGVFIRGKQLQCRDFLLAGPYKNLKKYKPQDWNELVITVKGNVAHCTCNGEVLEDAFEIPASGPIGLEGDRGQLEYRHIRINEEL